jgi:conjugative transfer region protein TrbK
MITHISSQQLVRIAAVGFVLLVVVLAILHSQRGEDAEIIVPFQREEANALASELARCRTVSSDQTAPLETCRRIWAENRRQFFRATKPAAVPVEPGQTAAAPSKIQDRFSPIANDQQRIEVR